MPCSLWREPPSGSSTKRSTELGRAGGGLLRDRRGRWAHDRHNHLDRLRRDRRSKRPAERCRRIPPSPQDRASTAERCESRSSKLPPPAASTSHKPSRRHGSRPSSRRHRPPPPKHLRHANSDEDLAYIAKLYTKIAADGNTHVARDLHQRLAAEGRYYTRSGVRSMIRRARKRGLLAPATASQIGAATDRHRRNVGRLGPRPWAANRPPSKNPSVPGRLVRCAGYDPGLPIQAHDPNDDPRLDVSCNAAKPSGMDPPRVMSPRLAPRLSRGGER